MLPSERPPIVLRAPSALGDVFDRISILEIKSDRITDARRENVARELEHLRAAWAEAGLPDPRDVPEYAALAETNRALWELEDRLRELEARGEFGAVFVEAARSVYLTNDRRAALKRAINERFGSALREEKQHPRY